MYNVSEQLDHLPATLPQIQYFVVVFQCYFLELCGILDYLEIYEPHINGILPPATTTANAIGAFTNNACIVQDLMITGISVFFFCPAHLFRTPGYSYLWSVVQVQEPSNICMSPCSPLFPIIFSSEASDPCKYEAIHHSIWSWQVLPKLFKDQSISLSNVSLTLQSISQPGLSCDFFIP